MDDGELEATIKTLIDRRNAVPEDILLTSSRGRENFNVKHALLFGDGLHGRLSRYPRCGTNCIST